MSVLIAGVILSGPLVGCQAYRLEGRVIEGQSSVVLVVDKNDKRLLEYGIADVVIETMLDPDSLRPQPLPTALTNRDGTFSIDVDATGAGFLEYDLFVFCRRRGFEPAAAKSMPLPPGNKRLLIVMAPGIDRPREGGSGTVDELIREKDQFEKQFP